MTSLARVQSLLSGSRPPSPLARLRSHHVAITASARFIPIFHFLLCVSCVLNLGPMPLIEHHSTASKATGFTHRGDILPEFEVGVMVISVCPGVVLFSSMCRKHVKSIQHLSFTRTSHLL